MKTFWAALFLLFLAAAAVAAMKVSAVAEDDIRCLRGVKDTLSDPDCWLDWNLANISAGSVCVFTGITCWNTMENRILEISLPSMSLTGGIPSALKFCRSTQILNLSFNSLAGDIPDDLCDWLPYLVTLDLSGNKLTGQIPPQLSRCGFLNILKLAGNALSGQIPESLSQLSRLKKLELANNKLSGPIPSGLAHFNYSAFDGNDGLCGKPLSPCG